ncbi:hypothetical protein O0555_21650 [Brevibacillus laterosporus]|uniref:hypothetical protein n=1 Tax=Brevibacillus laterosporus TaxID=1465 RepID=UPI0018CEED83|nr:hypothetical protein [Brevibacillus laterosporus]MBG9797126.1 hypothetical protein [Brevibacillus laterosporus]MCR8939910.1 hypothetical protein [Brevibacillus laterosporus]MCZ0842550.1 hypothetical protein [Brevibacillus laterosporus]MCZ0847566.1 hypothetical protein [Brevibacillus laterosporus]MED1909572.1 hypothetical protein [Brevibacillus laterosporus]
MQQYCTLEGIKTRYEIFGSTSDNRLMKIIEQQSILIHVQLKSLPDEAPDLQLILPIAAEEICYGEFLLSEAGANVMSGSQTIGIVKEDIDLKKQVEVGREYRNQGWDKLAKWLKPEEPAPFYGYLGGVNG